MKSILLVFIVLTLNNSLLGENKTKTQKPKSKLPQEKPVWQFDCKEKRDCLAKCNKVFVFQYSGTDQQYANRIRTECFSDCSRGIDCNKDFYESIE